MTNSILLLVLASSAVLRVSSTIQDTSVNPPGISLTKTAESEATINSTSLPVLSRKRRYIVFPKGSSVQSGFCESFTAYTPLTKRFIVGLTFASAWMLPTEAHELYLQKRDVDATAEAIAADGLGTKHRADLYTVLEGVFSVKGLNGRECIMRAVCEASEMKQNERIAESGELRQGTFTEELHKLIFAYPLHSKHRTQYDKPRQHAGKCGEVYSSCGSVLDIKV